MKNLIQQISKEAGTQESNITIINIDDYSVDFKENDCGVRYWAKLTKTGNIKKNSIRVNRF